MEGSKFANRPPVDQPSLSSLFAGGVLSGSAPGHRGNALERRIHALPTAVAQRASISARRRPASTVENMRMRRGARRPFSAGGRPDAQRRELGRAQRGRFDHLGPDDLRRPADRPGVCISRSFAAAPPSTRRLLMVRPASACIALDQVDVLQRDGLQRGARDVRPRRAARDAGDEPARLGPPVRRAEPGQRRDDGHAARVGHRSRQRLDLGAPAR